MNLTMVSRLDVMSLPSKNCNKLPLISFKYFKFSLFLSKFSSSILSCKSKYSLLDSMKKKNNNNNNGLFYTHFHELTKLIFKSNRHSDRNISWQIKNLHMKFDLRKKKLDLNLFVCFFLFCFFWVNLYIISAKKYLLLTSTVTYHLIC